jgi:hypothetical protein
MTPDESLQLKALAYKLIALATGDVVEVEPFDEAYYLEAYPDVKAAIPKYFSSGRDHYERCGKAEGRHATRPPPVVPVPLPEPPPAAGWEPRAAYPSVAALLADVNAHGHAYAVAVNGNQVRSGFGPADAYWTWSDGSVRTTKPADSGGGEIEIAVEQG